MRLLRRVLRSTQTSFEDHSTYPSLLLDEQLARILFCTVQIHVVVRTLAGPYYETASCNVCVISHSIAV